MFIKLTQSVNQAICETFTECILINLTVYKVKENQLRVTNYSLYSEEESDQPIKTYGCLTISDSPCRFKLNIWIFD